MALNPINSSVLIMASGHSTSHVASSKSRGRTGCAPHTAKYGEHPSPRRTVTLSAHKTSARNQNHFFMSPLVTLNRDCLISQCPLSIVPFACELYEDIRIPIMPYLAFSHFTAARNMLPLSVTIHLGQPQRQIISSRRNFPTASAVALDSPLASIYLARAQRAFTIYPHLFEISLICITSACIF